MAMLAAAMLTALASGLLCAAAPAALAQTETSASMRPSLLPDRLGASTALTLDVPVLRAAWKACRRRCAGWSCACPPG